MHHTDRAKPGGSLQHKYAHRLPSRVRNSLRNTLTGHGYSECTRSIVQPEKTF